MVTIFPKFQFRNYCLKSKNKLHCNEIVSFDFEILENLRHCVISAFTSSRSNLLFGLMPTKMFSLGTWVSSAERPIVWAPHIQSIKGQKRLKLSVQSVTELCVRSPVCLQYFQIMSSGFPQTRIAIFYGKVQNIISIPSGRW